MFGSNGAAFAALLPWYPLLVDRLGLSAAEFGFIVAAYAVGAIVSSALPAPLIARFGPARVAITGTVLLVVSIAAAGWSPAGWVLAICVFAAGFFDAITDVAQNVAGIRVEDASGRSILSSLHAVWSLGALAGGATSTIAASAGADLRITLAAVGAVCIAAVCVGARMTGAAARTPEASATAQDAVPRRGAWRTALLASLPLVLIAIAGTMVEDIGNNWAALAGRQLGGLPVEAAGIGFIVIIGSQCVGRFAGDRLIDRFGRVAVARAGGVLVALGGVLVILPTGLAATLLAGFACAGLGCATLVPSALGAAAKIPGLSEGAGVTIVAWLMRVGFLVTSPLIGTVADLAGLRWGLALLVVVGAVALLLGGTLEPAGRRRSDRR